MTRFVRWLIIEQIQFRANSLKVIRVRVNEKRVFMRIFWKFCDENFWKFFTSKFSLSEFSIFELCWTWREHIADDVIAWLIGYDSWSTALVFKSVGNPHGVRRKDFQGKRDEREIKRPQEGAILGEDKIWNDCNHVTEITRRFIYTGSRGWFLQYWSDVGFQVYDLFHFLWSSIYKLFYGFRFHVLPHLHINPYWQILEKFSRKTHPKFQFSVW